MSQVLASRNFCQRRGGSDSSHLVALPSQVQIVPGVTALLHALLSFDVSALPQLFLNTSDERVVYIDGAFDILHAGHVGALFAARRKGDFLLVGLHDDATVNRVRASTCARVRSSCAQNYLHAVLIVCLPVWS